jgi:hypothetical protein
MKVKDLDNITGTLSKPSKMPGFAYGIPAKECQTGAKLREVKGSTCFNCYALKGCYVFPNVQAAQYKRLEATTKTALGQSNGCPNTTPQVKIF